jgi:hypothetical protein
LSIEIEDYMQCSGSISRIRAIICQNQEHARKYFLSPVIIMSMGKPIIRFVDLPFHILIICWQFQITIHKPVIDLKNKKESLNTLVKLEKYTETKRHE